MGCVAATASAIIRPIMAIFFIAPTKASGALLARAQEVFGPDNVKPVGDAGFYVAFDGLSGTVKEKLGMVKDGDGRGVVISADTSVGFAPADIWEWLKLNGKG